MTEVRRKAFNLRNKGYSYNEINRIIGVPKSTLSGWFYNLTLTPKALSRLEKRKGVGTKILIERNKKQTLDAKVRAKLIKERAGQEISKFVFNKEILMIAGVLLYWAEGYKKLLQKNGREITSHIISFTNSDPEMVIVFIKFLTEVMNIKKEVIRISMRLFKQINEDEAIEYWQKVTKLSRSNFDKPLYVISKSSQGKRPFNRLPFGTIQVRVNSTESFYRLLGWIEKVKKQIINKPR